MDEFLKQLRDSHSDFQQDPLSDDAKKFNPLDLFKKWYKEAFDKECVEPNAMTLSTVNQKGMPSSRVIYLKELNDDGFVFFTNYNSEKGQDISENPQVSLIFFWEKLSRVVRIQGIAEKTTAEVSDEYFNSRPRESQLGAWASEQSEIIPNRESLEDAVRKAEEKFQNQVVPRPPHWGGYVIQPLYIEFWQGQPSRLHDRICFQRENINDIEWKVNRKNP